MIWCAGGASLGWNKSLQLFLPQSHTLNALYYVSFGHSRHVSSCFLLQHLVFRWVMMFANVLSLCNISPFIFAVTVWDLHSWFCFHCHPRYFAMSGIWHEIKGWTHISDDSDFKALRSCGLFRKDFMACSNGTFVVILSWISHP